LNLAEVHRVLDGHKATPPPRGELWIAPAVLASEGLPNSAQGVTALAVRLGADLSFLSCSGPQAVSDEAAALRAAVDATHARGLACGAVVNGPWQRLTEGDGLESALRRLAVDGETERRIAALARQARREVDAWDEAGADLIMLADDLAYDGGPYFAPALLDRLLLPHYRRLLLGVRRRRPIGFHSDGDLTRLLPALIQAGFACFSLEPEATRPNAVWRRFGRHVTVLSGIPAAWLTTPVASSDVLSGLADLSRGGSLILGSACGLFEPGSVDRLKTIYRLADGIGPAPSA
jgi:uroporphyrinogen decarboxylase